MLLSLVRSSGWIILWAPHSCVAACLAPVCALTPAVGTVDVCPAWCFLQPLALLFQVFPWCPGDSLCDV